MIKWSQNCKSKNELNKNNLLKRAEDLNKKFFNGNLKYSIEFVTNQNKRYGSYSISTNKIRISNKIIKMPRWIQNYIILHELTHVLHPNHLKKILE